MAKRIALEIETSELCTYGCGSIAKYKNGEGRLMCLQRANSCPAVRQKNSIKTKLSHQTRDCPSIYAALPESVKKNMAWNKGNCHADFSYGGKGSHKKILIREKGHKCESCQNSVWLNNPITLELEHIDGDNKNNCRENLKLLCPNCHSYTPTWRKAKKPANGYTSKVGVQVPLSALKS